MLSLVVIGFVVVVVGAAVPVVITFWSVIATRYGSPQGVRYEDREYSAAAAMVVIVHVAV